MKMQIPLSALLVCIRWGVNLKPHILLYTKCSSLSDPGLCQATGTFPKAQWPGDPKKCQWPQWPRTLPGHQDFPEGPVTRWPREMSVASVTQDFAGPPGLSRRPIDPVTPRNVNGLSGPGLCQATGTFLKAQWAGDPEKWQWPQWPGTLPGYRDFPHVPAKSQIWQNWWLLSPPLDILVYCYFWSLNLYNLGNFCYWFTNPYIIISGHITKLFIVLNSFYLFLYLYMNFVF